jgi:hypothetical protein
MSGSMFLAAPTRLTAHSGDVSDGDLPSFGVVLRRFTHDCRVAWSPPVIGASNPRRSRCL